MSRSALVVANGTLPRESIVRREVARAEIVLSADGGANSLARLGIVPQVVLGDFDSLATDLPETVQKIPAFDQDKTDLEKAIYYLHDEGYDEVTVTGVTGDRLDHTFAALALVCKHGVRLVDDVGEAVCVKGPGQLGLPTRPGQTISLLPCGPVSGVTTLNLKWELRGAEFNFAERDGTSNAATTDFVEVYVAGGYLVVYAHHVQV